MADPRSAGARADMGSPPAPICFVLGALQLGGIGRNALNLGAALQQRGQVVDFYLIKAEGAYLSQVPPSTRVFEGGGRTKWSLPSLMAYLGVRRPRVLITSNAYIHVLALCAVKLSRVPVRLICTAVTNITEERRRRTLYGRLLLSLGNWAYRRADAVVALSSGVADDVAAQASIARDRIHVIYNPAVTPALRDQASQSVPCEWLNDPETPVVMGVGRLTRQKDFPTLIRAFARVKQARDAARLVILGEGEDRESLERLVRGLDLESAVRFEGFVPDPAAYTSKASVFVLSSAWEGFGNVLAEAMAVGTPVVSTDCPSGPAEILGNGEYGPLVKVGDASALADAILATLEDPIDSEVLQERARVFSADAAADGWLGVIRAGRD